MIEIGYFSLWCSFLFVVFSCIISVMGLSKDISSKFKVQTANNRFAQMSRQSIVASFFCILLSSVTIWYAIFYHDFSVKYVFEHSAIDMPPFYLFTSFWSALEGSHLLWTLLLSGVCAVAVSTVSKENKSHYLLSICVALSVCLIFMLALNLTVSRPFTRMLTTHPVGLGMNALLQNPYMAIHPPMLFLGYSLLIIPFAYGFAALVKGSITQTWLLAVRRFSLIAWAILTIAIFLGGKWAYVVLGWGGYWAWDPVENASFMPWLATTAFLHTVLIYERTKKLPRLAVFLGMFAFILTFFGTFLTRSGVISSVHSFAESSIGPSYLLWIVFLCVVTLFLVFGRGHLLQEKLSFEPFKFSKEALLLFTNYFLLFLLTIVFFGTILPLIVEAISGTKISIQQPFYNSFAPWIGLVLVSILGVGNLAKWKSARIENPWLSIFTPLCIAFMVMLCFYFIKTLSFKSCVIYFLVLWTIFVLIADFIYKLKHINWDAKTFLKHHRSYFGAFIIHIGFLIAILGFSGYSQTISREVHLPYAQSIEFEHFILTNKGLGYSQYYNEKRITALVEARSLSTNETVVIKPARTKFTNSEQWYNEVGVHSKFWFDLYLVLVSFDIQDQSISLKVNYNPMVKFVWTSVVIMVLGALVALSSRFSFRFKRFPPAQHKIFSAFLILFVIGLTVFGMSGVAYAKNALSVEEVGQELRCPTCLGMSIMESETPQSIAMRAEVGKLLQEGKNKEEIISYFKDHYGSWILREPDASTPLGKILWAIPIFGFIAGPFVLMWRLARNNSHKTGGHTDV